VSWFPSRESLSTTRSTVTRSPQGSDYEGFLQPGNSANCRVVRYFWYISKTKLDYLLSQQETIFDRLRANLSGLIKAEVSLPGGSITLEVEASGIDAKQIRILEKVEKKLRDVDLVKSIEDFSSRRQPLFFEFRGPAARLIQNGQFWVATLDRETAVLLGGSSAHCIGGPNPVNDAISPSVDPVGSMQFSLERSCSRQKSSAGIQPILYLGKRG
jgi:hypothetical protein